MGGRRKLRTTERTEAKPEDLDLPPKASPPAVANTARKAGKPPGAPGIGWTQVFQAHKEQAHYPEGCAGCGRSLESVGAVAYSGFQAVDLH